jgi:hypothetical protein
VGDGFDTRPFRLPWPPGTVIFLVAPPESHERAEALLAGLEGGAPRVERGCLLRRVSLNLGAAAAAAAEAAAAEAGAAEPGAGNALSPAASSSSSASTAARLPPAPPIEFDDEAGGSQSYASSSSAAAASTADSPAAAGTGGGTAAGTAALPPAPTVLISQLERAGFRQDRLSLWALQGLHGLGLPPPALSELLADVTNSAAFHSLVVGELPLEGSRADAENALAAAGLLGAAYAHESEEVGGGFARLGEGGDKGVVAAVLGGGEGGGGEEGSAQRRRRWLFAAQQMRLSFGQMGIYEDNVEAVEGADEDLGPLHFS